MRAMTLLRLASALGRSLAVLANAGPLSSIALSRRTDRSECQWKSGENDMSLLHRFARNVTAVCLGLACVVAVQGAPLDPNAFTSLGTLNVGAGTLTINTDTLAISGAAAFTGVVHVQGAGLPDIAVFTFDDLAIASGVALILQGSRPIAILSKSDAIIDAVINASGASGTEGGFNSGNGQGGLGRLGGGKGGGANGNSTGPGNGGVGSPDSGGGGGGFGGTGGVGGKTQAGSPGGGAGGAYGDLSLALQGGSGGGGSQHGSGGFANGGGGAGGGAIEIGAVGVVSLGQGVNARGGSGLGNGGSGSKSGGGGSGGAILVHGGSVTTGAALDVRGNSGGFTGLITQPSSGGGGGGGGRIYVGQDTYTVGAAFPFSVVTIGGAGGRSVYLDGAPGNPGAVQIAPALTIIPSGQSPLVLDGGVATLANGWKLLPRDLAVQTGGVVIVTSPFSTGNDLDLSGGTAFAALGWTMTSAAHISGFGQLNGAVTGNATNQVTASGGALTLGDANSNAGFSFMGAVDVASGATLNLLDANAAELGSATTLAGGARLNSLNGVVLSAGEAMTASGAAQVDGRFTNHGAVHGPTAAGEFLTFTDDVDGPGGFAGNVLFSDGYSPGASPAQVSLERVAFDATAELSIELGGTTPGSQFDQVAVAGDATLGGQLTVSLIDGFTPSIGQTFAILTADDVDGTFATEVLPSVPGLILDVIYNPTSVVLTVSPAFTADFDEDGDVDGEDLVQWQGDFGANDLSDADDDGDSDGADFLAWQRQLGSGVLAAPVIHAVPEPGGAALALVTLGGVIGATRRRSFLAAPSAAP
jgi:hypothetical protein